MPDEASRWIRAQELFAELADMPMAASEARLTEACAGDATLRDMVSALLDADRRSGNVIDAMIAGSALDAVTSVRTGDTLGPWRLVRELGSGGMGTVYLAERMDDAYRGQVAIKCLRSTLSAPAMAQRFVRERQILADLVHPNIARLFDGGTAPDGSPYLVMEYIDGEPLDTWGDHEARSIPDRVQVFRLVCGAVEHAHRAFIVHRDIKPANILVTRDGTPKLLDFGIAKLVDTDRGATGDVTLYQALTPTWASPEQLRGQPLTTASDCYSLGVVLYRLLTGRAPHAFDGLSISEIEARVMAALPPAPSSRVGGDAARRLRGDLDTIVLKALHPDPPARYQSAGDLSEDLRRWLDGQPVSARPATVRYRMGRFIKRHPVAVTASVAAILALGASTTISVIQARTAERERQYAETRQRVAEAATGFLVELFQMADPNTNNGETISARQMLDRGAERVTTGRVSEPDVRATLALSLAAIYRNLADYKAAAPLVDTALALRGRTVGPRAAEYAAALHEHAELLYTAGAYDSTAAVHRRVLAILAEEQPGDADLTEASLYGLGVVLDQLSQYEEGERHLRDALAMSRRLRGDTGVDVSRNLLALASVLRHQTKHDLAIPMLEESLRLATASTGRTNLDVAQSLNHLARTLSLAGRSADAVAPATEAIAIQREIHAGPHPEIAASLGNLAGILGDLARFDEAERARRESLAMLRSVLGRDHPYIVGTLTSLGDLMMRKEDWPAAEDAYVQALAMSRRTLAPDNPDIAFPLTGLGRARLARGRAGVAEASLREAYDLRRTRMPARHWHIAASGTALGECLNALGRPLEAEPILREAVGVLEETFGAADARAARARRGLASALRATARTSEADSLDAIVDATREDGR